MYRLTPLGQLIQRIEDNVFFPQDETNKDYCEYLEWVAQGNQPAPALGFDFADVKAAILSKFRADRELFISRISQVVTFAEDSTTLMEPAKALRRGLLDLTSHASVTSATSEDELKAAMKAVYGGLVAAAPNELRLAFKGVDA